MPNPTAAMIVIGDEILSGRTRDANMHYLAQRLSELGITLGEVRVISDDHGAIVAAVRALAPQVDHLFTSGGIGPTHDDITAEAIADAMGVPIDVREDAKAILQAYYQARGSDLNEARLRMARIPEGAALIDNPISGAPGFTLGNIHVMAGVPRIFQSMVVSLIPRVEGGSPLLSQGVAVLRGEGDVAGPLGEIADRYPMLSIGSYPFNMGATTGTNIVLRGHDAGALERATKEVDALK